MHNNLNRYRCVFQCFQSWKVYLVSLSAGLVKAVTIVFFDSVNRHISLSIKFLSTAWKVGTLFVTHKWLALVHLGHLTGFWVHPCMPLVSDVSLLHCSCTIGELYTVEYSMLSKEMFSLCHYTYEICVHIIYSIGAVCHLRHKNHPWRCGLGILL